MPTLPSLVVAAVHRLLVHFETRRALERLDDRLLFDIGLDPEAVAEERRRSPLLPSRLVRFSPPAVEPALQPEACATEPASHGLPRPAQS